MMRRNKWTSMRIWSTSDRGGYFVDLSADAGTPLKASCSVWNSDFDGLAPKLGLRDGKIPGGLRRMLG